MSPENTINATTREIRSCITKLHSVVAAYGFGSYFRGARSPGDIDILLVVDDRTPNLIATYDEAYLQLSGKLRDVTASVDLLLLTQTECGSAPLRERGTLTPIFLREGTPPPFPGLD